VQGISDIITIPGIINRDFADVKAIMAGMGYAVMGTATAKGERRTVTAAQAAIASPLLEAGAIDGARGILINITGSSSLKLAEVNEASTIIQSASHEDANIIFGAVLDEKMKDEVKITVIATGFRATGHVARPQAAARQAVQSARAAHGAISFAPEEEQPAEVNQAGSRGATSETQLEHGRSRHNPSERESDLEEGPTVTPTPEIEGDDFDTPAYLRKRNNNSET